MLPNGGSFVTMVSSDGKNDGEVPEVTIVVEKLEGRCLRCAGQNTTTETVTFQLTGPLTAHKVLQVWQTNETAHFINLGNITVGSDSSFSVTVPRDSIVTVSSWFNGQSKGVVTIPTPSAFPLTLSDNFDSYKVDAEPRYFADNGGSFQVAADPSSADGNMVLKQWVEFENGVNRWGHNVRGVVCFVCCKIMSSPPSCLCCGFLLSSNVEG